MQYNNIVDSWQIPSAVGGETRKINFGRWLRVLNSFGDGSDSGETFE